MLQVCEWKQPEELAELLDLELRAAGEPHHRLLERVRDVAKYSIKTSKDAGASFLHRSHIRQNKLPLLWPVSTNRRGRLVEVFFFFLNLL